MKIRVHKERCSGCHLCEMVCSLFHTGRINIERSAIRIHKDDLQTSVNRPILCRQCRAMKCLEGEQVDATAARREFLWDAGRSPKCPFGALHLFDGAAYHCDLCGGEPQCVKVCTTRAVYLESVSLRKSRISVQEARNEEAPSRADRIGRQEPRVRSARF